jgi:hypothetical protein
MKRLGEEALLYCLAVAISLLLWCVGTVLLIRARRGDSLCAGFGDLR